MKTYQEKYLTPAIKQCTWRVQRETQSGGLPATHATREAGPNKGNQPIREDKEKLDQIISQANVKEREVF